jgi:hypothetical protein
MMDVVNRIRDRRIARPSIKKDDPSLMNSTASNDDAGNESYKTTSASHRDFMPRFSSPPDPGDKPPRAVLDFPPDPDAGPGDGFREGSGDNSINGDDDDRRSRAIPRFKNLMPKRVIARPTGAAAFVIDSFFGVSVYIDIKPFLDSITAFDWNQFFAYIIGSFNQLAIVLQGRNLIMFAALGFMALLVTYMWAYSDRKVSSCPVCKKKNYGNFNTCAKCDYTFYPREIIDHEILSIKLKNPDFQPEQIAAELKDRHIADLKPVYIKRVLVKNHFL